MKRFILVLMVFLLLLAVVMACAPEGKRIVDDVSIIKWHDDELNVTCWIYEDGGSSGGMSCIADWELARSRL